MKTLVRKTCNDFDVAFVEIYFKVVTSLVQMKMMETEQLPIFILFFQFFTCEMNKANIFYSA